MCTLKAKALETAHLMHKPYVSCIGWCQPEALEAPWQCQACKPKVHSTGMARNLCSTETQSWMLS